MTKLALTVAAGAEREKDYILARLARFSEIEVEVREFRNFTRIGVTGTGRCTKKIVSGIAASTISIFYKYRALNERLGGKTCRNVSYYALMGALLSIDLDEELTEIEKAARGLKEICLPALLEFRLPGLSASWEALASLGERLLAQCADDGEIYELVAFLLNLDSRFAPRVTVDGVSALSVLSDSVELTVPLLTGEPDLDAVIAVVREKPSSVVIKNPDSVSARLVEAIRSLGETER